MSRVASRWLVASSALAAVLLIGWTVGGASGAATGGSGRSIAVATVAGRVSGGSVSQTPVSAEPVPGIRFVVQQHPGANNSVFVARLSVTANVACGPRSTLSSGELPGELVVGSDGRVSGTLHARTVSVTFSGVVNSQSVLQGTVRVVQVGRSGCDSGPLTWLGRFVFAQPHIRFVRLPRVVGLTLAAATGRLRARGLRVAPGGDVRYAAVPPFSPYSNRVTVVPSSGAGLHVVGEEAPAVGQVPVGSEIDLITVRAPGGQQALIGESIAQFKLSSDQRTVTFAFESQPASCRPLDHVDVIARKRWVIADIALSATTDNCQQLPLVRRTVKLQLPSRLNGRPILPYAPAFARHDLLDVHAFHWNSRDCSQPCGYLAAGGRIAIINYTDGVCAKLASVNATVRNRTARITLYEGDTQTFFPCADVGYSEVTIIHLPRPATRIVDGTPP